MTLRKCLAAVLCCLLGVSSFLLPTAATAQASVTGQWARLNDLPFGPVHEALMPDGKVLMWGRDTDMTYLLWDPATQFLSQPGGPGYDQFCAGQAYLSDGGFFVAGGHVVDSVGLPNASIYDTATGTWTRAPDMNAGRWYPTVTTLSNGDALVVSGQIDTTVGTNPLPQVYQAATNTWRDLTNAQMFQDGAYPMMFLAPNGKVLYAGPTQITRYLDTSGTGAWAAPLANHASDIWRDYGSAVMYDAGKVLVLGGGDPPTATAEIIDLNAPAPAWSFTGAMSQPRRNVNATLLPDGTVLATGGTSGSGFNNTATAVLSAELWNPATGSWTQLASESVARVYHSSALLLPDGRVLSVGGNDTPSVEIFSPPYLFKGARPSMSAVPSRIGYGQQFSVQSPDAAGISKVTLIRLASVTHSLDQNQRMNVLQYTVGSGALNVTAPANANLAPPSLYMLFIVNGTGVPSIGSLVQLGAGSATVTPPTLTSLSPNSATAGGAAFTLTVNGSNFVSGATVNWNGAARSTTFVSGTQVTAAISASDIAAAGTAQVTAINPGTTASNALTFTVSNPTPPSLTSLSPASVTAGGAAFTLTVNGSNFVSGATVNWNGAARTTTFVSATQVRAAIPAGDIAASGTAQVSAINPGTAASNALTFTVSIPTPPSLTSLSPATATAGGAAFTLTVNGSNFVSGATVNWNGAARTTTFVSATQVRAAIPASDIAAAGTAQVMAVNPGSTGSNALALTINPAVPAFSLAVTKNGSAATRGTVTSSPGGVNCGSVCSASFNIGTTVTLTISTNGNGVFAGWSGACSGSGACILTMDANRSVTATINRR